LPVTAIDSIVGVWNYNERVYILRKHPGLTMLNAEETGKESDIDGQEGN